MERETLFRAHLKRNRDVRVVASLLAENGRTLTFSGLTVGWLGIGVLRGVKRCDICGGRRDVAERGWTDEGVPMATCAKCGGPGDDGMGE